jgi:cyclase
VPLGVAPGVPVVPPVPGGTACGERFQHPLQQPGNGVGEAVPAGVQVVHPHQRGILQRLANRGGQGGLARARGAVHRDHPGGAGPGRGGPHRPGHARGNDAGAAVPAAVRAAIGAHRGGAYADGVAVAVRVIPCLDVDSGRVVKGVNFTGLRDAGDPVELARRYDAEGADELTFLDVTASADSRDTTFEVVSRTAEEVFIPLTVGGGVRTVEDVDRLLRAGADKVGVNTAAIARPALIAEVAERFGSQVLVLSVDARRCPPGTGTPSGYEVTTHGGRRGTGIDAVAWAAEAAALGAGEILLNSMDADGTRAGFDLPMLREVRAVVSVPLVASGGAGAVEHFLPAVEAGADAVLAASVFHFAQLSIAAVKQQLRAAGVPVR